MLEKRTVLKITLVLSIITLFFPACSIFSPSPIPTQDIAAAYTAAAQTIIAQITQNVPPVTPTPMAIDIPTPAFTETSIPTDTPLATNTVEPTPTSVHEQVDTATPIPTLVFEDDFKFDTDWYTDKGEDFGFKYVQDGYQIYVNIRNAPVWSVRERDFGDVRLEVDASIIAGAEDGYYGLVCRHKDEDNYYALVISGDGTFGIAKSIDGEFEFVQTGKAEPGMISSAPAVNRVRADCVGDSLTLYANDHKLFELQDDDFDSGYIGLIAGTRSGGGIEVLFDNFVIYKP